jgi:K+-transporting ATPase KdpF subunit
LLVFHKNLRSALKESWVMDFIVAGVAAVALFFYLLYALLKPERF